MLKRKVCFFMAVICVFAIAMAGCGNDGQNETTTNGSTVQTVANDVATTSSSEVVQGTAETIVEASQGEYIAPNMALKIATSHAGVYDAVDTEVELDIENGKAIYEVSFEKGNTDYEYEIDAVTGDVLRYESEIDD